MKTPMQELIEQFEDRLSSLKEVQATANLETQDFLETQIEELEGCILSAELMLEKEKEKELLRASLMQQVSELTDNEIIYLYDELSEFFNTKER